MEASSVTLRPADPFHDPRSCPADPGGKAPPRHRYHRARPSALPPHRRNRCGPLDAEQMGHRYRGEGLEALSDRSSAPSRRPRRLPIKAIDPIGTWRREHKRSARRIHLELTTGGYHCCLYTVGRWLNRLGISRSRDLDPNGGNNRQAGRITARFPGHMLHRDVKKLGAIPDGGALAGSWARQQACPGRPAGSQAARGMHLSPLSRRWVLPPGIHRSPHG